MGRRRCRSRRGGGIRDRVLAIPALAGQGWRLSLPPWKFSVNAVSVVIVHTVLAFIKTYAIYRIVGLGFIGLPVGPFGAVVMMAVTVGLTSRLVCLSVSRMTTQRMSSLLLTFVALGVITATVISPDPNWWRVHFSERGTFGDLASRLMQDISAAGLAVIFLAMLISGPKLLRGMPRTYFVAASLILFATVASVVLFFVGYFTLTAIEIIVFVLIFGWISVFIRFLGVAGQDGGRAASA